MNKLLAVIMLIFVSNVVHSQEEPSTFLESVANKLISEIQKNKKELTTDTKLAEKLVRTHLLPAIDTSGFAKRTIGKKSWSAASEIQQQKFVDLFIGMVIGNYAKGLALYDGQVFKFSPAKLSKNGNGARIRSSMEQTGATPIIIDYLLSKKTGSWKIINLTIEGVSMVKSYRSQFSPRIKELGMEAFLVELESKQVVVSGK